jgi:hypothetical protein
VVLTGGVEEDDPLLPHPAKASRSGRISSLARGAFAFLWPRIAGLPERPSQEENMIAPNKSNNEADNIIDSQANSDQSPASSALQAEPESEE